MITGNEPITLGSEVDKCGNPVKEHLGLPIRQHFAAMAMQGLISNAPNGHLSNSKEGCKLAVDWADALIAELNK